MEILQSTTHPTVHTRLEKLPRQQQALIGVWVRAVGTTCPVYAKGLGEELFDQNRSSIGNLYFPSYLRVAFNSVAVTIIELEF